MKIKECSLKLMKVQETLKFAKVLKKLHKHLTSVLIKLRH